MESLERLQELQQFDGCFLSMSSGSLDMTLGHQHKTTFFTSCIVLALSSLPPSKVGDEIMSKSFEYLLSQKSPQWSWNYWEKDSPEVKKHAYPDDFDDTALAFAALWQVDNLRVSGMALASLTKLLISQEVAPGGPYSTWLVPQGSAEVWKDVDLAVNANIALVLEQQGITLPGLTAYIEEKINTGTYGSRYYPFTLSSIYFLTRAYNGKNTKKLQEDILQLQHDDGTWGSVLETALACTSLIRLKYRPSLLKKALQFLSRQEDFSAYAFCIDPSINGVKHYAGSEALTIVLCLESLSLASVNVLKRKSKSINHHAELQAQISSLPTPLQHSIQPILEKILSLDGKLPITTLPELTVSAVGKNASSITSATLSSLSMANVYGWVAYTIFDDFLDGEGTGLYLPSACWSLREMHRRFSGEFLKQPKLLEDILDLIDGANAWEQESARLTFSKDLLAFDLKSLPDYGDASQLAHRSIGYALPSLAILVQLGYTALDNEITDLRSFFHHFLIARQLNDDAHDWAEDMQKGQLSSTVVNLLQEYAAKKNLVQISVPWEQALPELRELLWVEVMGGVIKDIHVHLQEARLLLDRNKALTHPEILYPLLESLEKAASHVEEERLRTKEFIASFQKK